MGVSTEEMEGVSPRYTLYRLQYWHSHRLTYMYVICGVGRTSVQTDQINPLTTWN